MTKRVTKGIGDIIELGATGSLRISEGNLMFVTVSGHALTASTNGPAGSRFIGVAMADVDNSTGAAGALNCPIATGPDFIFRISSSALLTDASIGLPLHVSGPDSVALSGTQTNGLQQVGTLHKVDSGSWVYVRMERNLGSGNLTP